MAAFENVDLKKQPQLREIIVFGALLVLVLYVFLDMLLSPQFEKIKEAKAKLKAASQQKEAVERLISALDKQVEQQETSRGETEKRQQGPQDERLQKILSYKVVDINEEITATISKLSGRHLLKRIKYLDSEVGQHQVQKGYTLVPIELKLEGHYTALIRYIEDLEAIDQPLLVSGFEFSSPGPNRFLVAKLNIELYLPK